MTCHGVARGEYNADAVYRLPPGIFSTTAAPITVLARTSHDECTVFARMNVPLDMAPNCFQSIWDLSAGTICAPGIRVRVATATDELAPLPADTRPAPAPHLCEIIDTQTTKSTNSTTTIATTTVDVSNATNEMLMLMVSRFPLNRLDWSVEAESGAIVVQANLRVAHPDIHLTRQVVSADGLFAAPQFISRGLLLEEVSKLLSGGTSSPCDGNALMDLCKADSCEPPPTVRVYVRTRFSKTGIAYSSSSVDRNTNDAINGLDLSPVAEGMALRFVRVHTSGRYIIEQNVPGASVRQTSPFDAETTVDLLPLQTAFDRNEPRCPMGVMVNGGDPANGLRVFLPGPEGPPRFILRRVDGNGSTSQVRVTCIGTAVSCVLFARDTSLGVVMAGNFFCGLLEPSTELWNE